MSHSVKTRNKAIELIKQGEKHEWIALEVGASTSTIGRWALEEGLTRRPIRIKKTQEQALRAAQRLLEGATVKRASQVSGISETNAKLIRKKLLETETTSFSFREVVNKDHSKEKTWEIQMTRVMRLSF